MKTFDDIEKEIIQEILNRLLKFANIPSVLAPFFEAPGGPKSWLGLKNRF